MFDLYCHCLCRRNGIEEGGKKKKKGKKRISRISSVPKIISEIGEGKKGGGEKKRKKKGRICLTLFLSA